MLDPKLGPKVIPKQKTDPKNQNVIKKRIQKHHISKKTKQPDKPIQPNKPILLDPPDLPDTKTPRRQKLIPGEAECAKRLNTARARYGLACRAGFLLPCKCNRVAMPCILHAKLHSSGLAHSASCYHCCVIVNLIYVPKASQNECSNLLAF